ncbi:MAG: cache domain-containing protein, partial [Chloroflexi bacterium]|nr:cache domain-containing protein [Chloroflexota bacterium]
MAHQALLGRLKRKVSLTAAISILLTLVAIVPLLITVTSSQVLSRPQLISQSANSMAQEAHTRVQLVDAYLLDRLRDVQTVSSLFSLQEYVQGNQAFKQQALNALAVGNQNDVNYDTWSVLDLQGNALLSYPTQPRMHGKVLISPEMLGKIQRSTNALFSGVFYEPDVGEASIVIYAPIIDSASKTVGILRAEFALTYIWNVVNSQADSMGGYGFILDEHGVRIAYTNTGGSTSSQPAYLFKAIAP